MHSIQRGKGGEHLKLTRGKLFNFSLVVIVVVSSKRFLYILHSRHRRRRDFGPLILSPNTISSAPSVLPKRLSLEHFRGRLFLHFLARHLVMKLLHPQRLALRFKPFGSAATRRRRPIRRLPPLRLARPPSL